MRAKAEVLRVVRAVLTLSLMQPRPRLPTLSGTRPWLPTLSVTPLRPAEHYHTYGELELNRKTPWFACKVLVQHDCTHSQRKPCILAVPEGRWWALEAKHRRTHKGGTRRNARRLEPLCASCTTRTPRGVSRIRTYDTIATQLATIATQLA